MYNVEWQVDDGYVGGRRPQETKVRLHDFEEDMDIEDIKDELIEIIQEDFIQNIHWEADNIDEVAAQIYNDLQEKEDD